MALLLSSVVAAFKASLGAAAGQFRAVSDGDFVRMLQLALVDMQAKRPITRPGEVELFPYQPSYLLAAANFADFAAFKTHLWADPAQTPKPWDACWPGAVPRVAAQRDGTDWYLELSPAPTPRQLAVWGSTLKFWYFARHVLSETPGESTVNDNDLGLLLLRAQAEAMRELAMANVVKTTQMRDGYSGTPRNGTPTALFELLMNEFKEAR